VVIREAAKRDSLAREDNGRPIARLYEPAQVVGVAPARVRHEPASLAPLRDNPGPTVDHGACSLVVPPPFRRQPSWRGYCRLAGLAPHLPPSLLADALEAARAIEEWWPRAVALAGLVPHLAAEQRGQALAEALQAARVIGDVRPSHRPRLSRPEARW